MKYVSNKGESRAVDFETAILNGYAPDGGLYVPETLPKLSDEILESWSHLSYKDLAFEVISLFTDTSDIPAADLRELINTAYDTFEREEVITIHPLTSRQNTYIMELFYGPTLSFKDVGQSFLITLLNYFLKKRKEHMTVVVATTGDTGPAAARYIAGKSHLDGWILYPKGMITEEQERQMTTLSDLNIHPVGVTNCPEGGDDLDAAIHQLYANKEFREKVRLTSVNSINWGRIMVQMVHYFYGYFQVAKRMGEEVSMAVPSGGFGNLCAGGIARKMGLPLKHLIIGNNKNEALHRIFSQGICSKKPIYSTVSSAIDILIPYNFWRYLFFCVDKDSQKIRHWLAAFDEYGVVKFDKATFQSYREGFLSRGVSNKATLDMIKKIYQEEGYLLDPHGAVALSAVDKIGPDIIDHKVICHATAHPAKFPKVIKRSLGIDEIPSSAKHVSIEAAKKKYQKVYLVDQPYLYEALVQAMDAYWEQTKGN